MIDISERKCTGCGECVAICPSNAISMTISDEGFWYPVVNNDYCVKCGKCVNSCPVISAKPIIERDSDVYVSWTNNDNIRENSSSGGIFSELALEILKRNGTVIGAVFDVKSHEVIHRIIQSEEELYQIQGSKYVQSFISKEIYYSIKEYLEEDYYVLFSGTPCQVAGIKQFLNKEYEKLILIDIVCHGVPSPRVWKMYLEDMERIYKDNIINCNFRFKGNGWKKFEMYLKFGSKEYSKWFNLDAYGKSFINNMFLRTCCYDCRFKEKTREGDITLGDFWKVSAKYDFDDKGCSLVICSTDKGKEFFGFIKDNVFFDNAKIEDAYPGNYALYKSSSYYKKRNDAFEMLNKKGFINTLNYYMGDTIIHKIMRKLKII